jgi:hypothetical protein
MEYELYQLITQIRVLLNSAIHREGLPAVQWANQCGEAGGDSAGNADEQALAVLLLELRAVQGFCVDACVDSYVRGLNTIRFR